MSQNTSRERLDIIRAIKTPLGFFTLLVLVIEAITVTTFATGIITPEIVFMQSLVLLLIGFIVASVAINNPKSLSNLNVKERINEYRSQEEINNYMQNLLCSGSTLDLVSNRLSWVSEDEAVKNTLIERSRVSDLNIYIPQKNQISSELSREDVNVHIVPSLGESPNARFTLVDMNRPGGALLAIAFGRLPEFKIQEFSEVDYPHIIALARDYIGLLRTGNLDA